MAENSYRRRKRQTSDEKAASQGSSQAQGTGLTVFITTAEHPFVPGTVVKVFASREGADAEAADLVNIIRKDTPDVEAPEATAQNWQEVLKPLAEHHETDYDVSCWIEVTQREVQA